jgi:hypothetical protein
MNTRACLVPSSSGAASRKRIIRPIADIVPPLAVWNSLLTMKSHEVEFDRGMSQEVTEKFNDWVTAYLTQ